MPANATNTIWISALAAVAACAVAGCGPSPGAGGEPDETIGEDTLAAIEGENDGAQETIASYEVPSDELIHGDGVGLARVGMSLAEFGVALGDRPIRFEPDYGADFSAVCVDDADGEELYCAVVPQTEQLAGGDAIVMVETRHPRMRTQEGVGPGVSLADAEVVYGPAILLYNVENESREYVEFERGPAGSIGFRPLSPSAPDDLVGLYAETEDALNETEDYKPDAVIGAIEVYGP